MLNYSKITVCSILISVSGLLMFKLLPGNVYTGNDHNSHVGSEAKFQSKHVPSGNGLAGQIW